MYRPTLLAKLPNPLESCVDSSEYTFPDPRSYTCNIEYIFLHCFTRRDYMNPYIPVAPHGIDPSLAVGITNPGGPNPMEGNVLLCSVSLA